MAIGGVFLHVLFRQSYCYGIMCEAPVSFFRIHKSISKQTFWSSGSSSHSAPSLNMFPEPCVLGCVVAVSFGVSYSKVSCSVQFKPFVFSCNGSDGTKRSFFDR